MFSFVHIRELLLKSYDKLQYPIYTCAPVDVDAPVMEPTKKNFNLKCRNQYHLTVFVNLRY